jgi:bacterioferritin-associated ferredoxin
MNADDPICHCYHVSLRKLVNFAQREQPLYASQMSECLGAGTGCGWCIPYLCQIAEAVRCGRPVHFELTSEQYAAARQAYRSDSRGSRHRFPTEFRRSGERQPRKRDSGEAG